ncbi:hypothetical protein KIPB_001822 [Kipferlia bialata]|uniref:Uncharacterized protein n=1 Tax=Kipferlia bialata TaxID=797122 RepID=A0A9K3GFR1_9EUKA|nr:hypothetical protein KIPB_001822 [Kipferlia bialata]|eukprot:g1822.t1
MSTACVAASTLLSSDAGQGADTDTGGVGSTGMGCAGVDTGVNAAPSPKAETPSPSTMGDDIYHIISSLTTETVTACSDRVTGLFSGLMDRVDTVPLSVRQSLVLYLAETIVEDACMEDRPKGVHVQLLKALKSDPKFSVVYPDEYETADGEFPPFSRGFEQTLAATRARLTQTIQSIVDWRNRLITGGDPCIPNPLLIQSVSFERLGNCVARCVRDEFRQKGPSSATYLPHDCLSKTENERRKGLCRSHMHRTIRFIGDLYNNDFLPANIVAGTCLRSLVLDPILIHTVRRFPDHDVMSPDYMDALRYSALFGETL